MNKYSITYEIDGVVQGVGFRPTLYRLANSANLGGWIKNTSGGVNLCLIGDVANIADFIENLHNNIPTQSQINKITTIEKKDISHNYSDPTDPTNPTLKFEIIDSSVSNVKKIVIPADIAMCKECKKEILNCENRRYGYPFTTCTNCGPRYTVVNDMPYDRERTTLADFPLCNECKKEYKSPENRRFHAESMACPKCGPSLSLVNNKAEKIITENQLFQARQLISEGNILAVRGVGGYLLAVDAFNRNAICELRKRKNRPDKPFALMFKDIETVFKYCKFDSNIVKLLKSPEAPILIAEVNEICELPIDLISPDTKTLGVMIPYSPLHKLIFEQLKDDKTPHFEVLIMTSGNKGGEPICISNEDAIKNLANIADFMLCHNRKINLRNDDSIVTIQLQKPQTWRRARGYAPNPLNINVKLQKNIIAMGADLKNSIAVGYDNEVVFSPHIGDLETLEAINSCKNIAKSLPLFLKKNIDLIVTDFHPDFNSTKLGNEIATKLDVPIVKVQHHHAHAVSCMAEHNLTNAIALIFDGTGLGLDKNIWGAELFHIKSFEDDIKRLATFAPVHLPGGDNAVLEPKRQLIARLLNADIKITNTILEKYNISEEECRIWTQQCKNNINAPLSHSAGRLFDAFATFLGIAPETITYEGQAAISLEAYAKSAISSIKLNIPFQTSEKDNMLTINWKEAFQHDYNKQNINNVAMAFHQAVADSAIKMIEYALSHCETSNIVLSGGVFMNKILNNLIAKSANRLNLNIFIHNRVPPNDGGIALGQIILGNYRCSHLN